ncbi:MAG TPA: MBL fold metallo-hydrolase [Gemmatimonadaceae bacterium]|nr:MBL fold metallo-hydrolase [Gemmatimonadaceae bacterium]
MVTATWVGHSTALIQLGPLNVLTDPMWSYRASPVAWAGPARLVPPPMPIGALPPIDVVLISHDHYDHLDRSSVAALAAAQRNAVWFAPLGVAPLLRRWGVRHVRELDWWNTVEDAGAAISCVPARHFSGRMPWGRARTLWCGWTIVANGWRAYFAGDTAYHPEFQRIAERHGPFDLVLLPVGAYEPRWFMGSVHMNPADAVRAYRDLLTAHPDAVPPPMLPIHWGTFRLTDEPADEPPEQTRQHWEAAGLHREHLWMPIHGQTWRRGRRG